MVDAFDARAYGPLIVLFAAPNMLPVALPGISAVLGVPLILLTAQMMIGLRRPWLPEFLRRRSLARGDLRVAGRSHRAAARPHRGHDPAAAPAPDQRLGHAADRRGGRGPRHHRLPAGALRQRLPGLALVLMAVGLLGRDGLAVVVGGLVGVAGLVVVSGFLYGAMAAAMHLARGGLGI